MLGFNKLCFCGCADDLTRIHNENFELKLEIKALEIQQHAATPLARENAELRNENERLKAENEELKASKEKLGFSYEQDSNILINLSVILRCKPNNTDIVETAKHLKEQNKRLNSSQEKYHNSWCNWLNIIGSDCNCYYVQLLNAQGEIKQLKAQLQNQQYDDKDINCTCSKYICSACRSAEKQQHCEVSGAKLDEQKSVCNTCHGTHKVGVMFPNQDKIFTRCPDCKSERKPHKCPACDPEIRLMYCCQVCYGTGVVWEPK